MAEFDQALFLYLNSQDQTPAIQDQPQTLNIFPSQPMHVVEPAPKGPMGISNTAPNAGAGPSKPPSSSHHPSRTTPAAAPKDGKLASSVKREAGGGAAATGSGTPSTSNQQEGPRTPDAKTLRRLAQNREAARKSRLRKKHARWQEEHGKMMRHLRAALEAAEQQQHAAAVADAQLRQLVDAAAAHHGVLAELKAAVARADAFHIVSGAWVSAAERCFFWIGGFRPSELIKVAVRHAEPLTEQQAMGICGVQQWATEAEAALDHELQAMHRSVSEAVSPDAAALLSPYSDVPGYMAAMSLAIAKLSSLEAFALHRLPQIMSARQSARCFLAVADYSHRLRALSELWHTRPRHEPPAAGSSHGPPPYQSRDSLL
nr:unnamed protein product [Digitaria exilis]